MSILILESGDQNAYRAIVDEDGRLTVKSVTQTFEERSVELGNAYNLNTGTIALTTDGASGLSYLKSNEEKPIIIQSFIYLLGSNTGGSGDGQVTIIENPTGGNLLTSTAGTPKNRNTGLQNKTIDVDWRIGAEAKTISGGTTLIDSIFATSTGRQVVAVPTVLTKGSSVAVKYIPPSGTTAQNVQIAFAIYLDIFNI